MSNWSFVNVRPKSTYRRGSLGRSPPTSRRYQSRLTATEPSQAPGCLTFDQSLKRFPHKRGFFCYACKCLRLGKQLVIKRQGCSHLRTGSRQASNLSSIDAEFNAFRRNHHPTISRTIGITFSPNSAMQRMIFSCDKVPAEYFMSKRERSSALMVAVMRRATVSGEPT
jgi:hypothetical protein